MSNEIIWFVIEIVALIISMYGCWKVGTCQGFLDGISYGDTLTGDEVSKAIQSMLKDNEVIVCNVFHKNGIKCTYKITEAKHNG